MYIDKKDKVWVVNLSPFDDSMNPGLFSMEELNTLRGMKEKSEAGEENSVAKEANDAEKEPVLRVVEEEAGTLPSEQMFYQVPMEMYSLSSTDQISSFIQQLKKEKEDEGKRGEKTTCNARKWSGIPEHTTASRLFRIRG